MADGPVYDAVELRRRIVVCFSMSELRELADALGVGGLPWDRGPQEAARELVRQCERYAGLPALVAKLREVRPLVEWPEPAASAAPAAYPSQAPPPAAPPTAASQLAPAFPPAPALSASPGTLQPGLAQPAPEVPSPAAPPIVDPFGAPAPAAKPASAPLPPAQPSPIWPGTYVGPPPRAGLDPRLIAAGVGLTALLGAAIVIAFLAGRATGEGTTASPAASSTASPAGAHRADGPAAMVTDAIARSLANVARTCELPESVGESVAVFARVYERCGPQPLQPRSALPPVPVPPPAPSDTAEPTTRPRRPGRGGGDAPPSTGPGQGCLSKCNGDHRACDAHCGPEPTDSESYANYQRCLGRCLSDSSRCMQGCH